jgi:hypothetical protein
MAISGGTFFTSDVVTKQKRMIAHAVHDEYAKGNGAMGNRGD